jgi:hypothetical protein
LANALLRTNRSFKLFAAYRKKSKGLPAAARLLLDVVSHIRQYSSVYSVWKTSAGERLMPEAIEQACNNVQKTRAGAASLYKCEILGDLMILGMSGMLDRPITVVHSASVNEVCIRHVFPTIAGRDDFSDDERPALGPIVSSLHDPHYSATEPSAKRQRDLRRELRSGKRPLQQPLFPFPEFYEEQS